MPSKDSTTLLTSTMWSQKLANIFLAKEFTEAEARQTRNKKSVSFSLDTKFSPGREKQHFMRGSPKYLAGKHASPQGFGGWLDTSLMYDGFEQLLDLKVHATFRVRDKKEAAALQNAFHTQMNACHPLVTAPRTPILLRFHPLCEKILSIFAAIQAERYDGESDEGDEEWRVAKALIIYATHEGVFVSLQFVNDTEEERDAHRYTEELRRSIPVANVGIPPHVRLQMLRETEASTVKVDF